MAVAAESCGILATTNQTKECHRPEDYNKNHITALQQHAYYHHHHHHVQEGLGLIPVPCILKMKLVPPSLPRSSYVSLSFWFIL